MTTVFGDRTGYSTGISRPACIFRTTHDEIGSAFLGFELLPRICLNDEVNKRLNITVNLTWIYFLRYRYLAHMWFAVHVQCVLILKQAVRCSWQDTAVCSQSTSREPMGASPAPSSTARSQGVTCWEAPTQTHIIIVGGALHVRFLLYPPRSGPKWHKF